MKLKFALLTSFTVLTTISLNLLFEQKANAWVNICNQGSTNFRLAVGYSEENGDWKSDGWWDVDPGQCRRVYHPDLKNSGKQFYYYVEGQGWRNQANGALCVANNRNFTFYKGQIESICGQVLTRKDCKWGTNGAGCTNVTETYYTKFVNFAIFSTKGRNFTLNLRN